MLNIIVENENVEVVEGTLYYDLAREYERKYKKTPYLVSADGVTKELRRHVRQGEDIKFLFFDNDDVKEAYAKTAIFVLLKAIFDIFGNDYDAGLKFRIHNSYYFEIEGKDVDDTDAFKVKKEYMKIVEDKIFIKKISYQKNDAMKIFSECKMDDARLLFRYNYRPVINLRKIDDYVKYINGSLLYDTSYVKYFEIRKFHNGLLLELPNNDDVMNIQYDIPGEKLFNIHNVSVNWAKKLRINTVGKLNESIADGKFNDLVIMMESFQDKQIGDIAEAILKSNKKLVFIAGPSSSGKTSFANRLMYHLRAVELNPVIISCDDFFVNRVDSPKKPNGEYDFEAIENVDIGLLNKTLNELLQGNEADIPKFDFFLGEKKFGVNKLKIKKNDIVIVEGIHCLNPVLTPNVDSNNIFKIYIAALIEVAIDNANRISTSDLRLIRRIVRDNRARGNDPKKTIKMWKSVREGEEKYIFPFQEEADILFNSALIYEFSVLKIKVLPLLYRISEDPEVGETAKRLIKILNYFLGVDTDVIPRHSVIREFIGDSILDVE